jgi:hypothetical protein
MIESNRDVIWLRSRACADGACAEVGRSGDEVFVRNSQRPAEVTRFTIDEWEAFSAGITAGDFPF